MGEVALFESVVICEYLDEITPPSLHPPDPLQKAFNRAWIEFSSELFVNLHQLSLAGDEAKLAEAQTASRQKLERLEKRLGEGPFFNGPRFSLVDAAIAPAFMRISLLEELRPLHLLDKLPKVRHWSEALLQRESVGSSVVPEFPALFREYLASASSYLARGAASA